MNNIVKIGKECVGCRSCEQSCIRKCITIKEDNEGFIYPTIDEGVCVQCGMCIKTCPVNSELTKECKPKEIYAFKEKNKKDILLSASGGASNVAVKAVIASGGVVYGAAYNENLVVQHIEAIDECGRKALQSSKYVQSDTRDTYTKARERLQNGVTVLYTGTPCQIAGLYAFLGKDFENLYTLDLICHGVPSPKFFRYYLDYRANVLGENVKSYNFRSKYKRGWGTQYLLKTETQTQTRAISLDKYGKHFMAGDCYRESCYNCRYANLNRPADMTVGDFWGVYKSHPEFASSYGVSSVLVNTEKGMQLLEMMKENAEIIPITLEEALAKQKNLLHPTYRPGNRDSVYQGIDENNYIEMIHVGIQLKERVKTFLPRTLVNALKKMI